jgi:S1-C subfamily serine protease
MAYQRPGNTLTLEVLREGKKQTLKLDLMDKNSHRDLVMRGVVHSKYLGADFQALNAQDCERYKVKSGIRILNVQRGGTVSQMSLPPGFIVLQFNGKTVSEAEDLIAAMEGSQGRLEIKGIDPAGNARSYSFFRY